LITLFWLLDGALILIAFWIILPPLWRKHAVPADDQDQRNITIAAHRLTELKAQLNARALSQIQYDEQVAELEAVLSDDLDIALPVKTSVSQGRWMVFVLVLALPLVALSLYAALGNYRALTVLATAPTPELAEINVMVTALAERLTKQPDDAQGWLMLGRSYKYLQQYPKAVDAFEHAYQLMGEQPEVMLLYAEAMAFANNEQLAGKPAELVFKVLAMEPDNVTGLWFGGMAKAQTGDFVAARTLWTKLEALLPPDSTARQEVQGLLAKLATEMPAGTAQVQSKSAQPENTKSIEVQVSLAQELQAFASPDDTVFVYAQALSGPQMPLVIVRKQVADLPLTVKLNDSMAMMPAMKLSNFEQVKLVARISKSGNAVQQAGDLIGIVEPVVVAETGIKSIVIKDKIK
jgi:cytochrome c-type biogenesis protein CcmH